MANVISLFLTAKNFSVQRLSLGKDLSGEHIQATTFVVQLMIVFRFGFLAVLGGCYSTL